MLHKQAAESGTPPPRLRVFLLEVAFLWLVCIAVGLYLVRDGPPEKPQQTVADLAQRIKDLKDQKADADKLHDARMSEFEIAENSKPKATERDLKGLYSKVQQAEQIQYSLRDELNQALDEQQPTKDAGDQYDKDYHDYEVLRIGGLYIAPILVVFFFVVVYYGTSYEVTPLRFLLPWAFRKYRATPRSGDQLGGAVRKGESAQTPTDILYESVVNAAGLAVRMERRTNTHLILGVAIGLLGVIVSVVLQSFVRYGYPYGMGFPMSLSLSLTFLNMVPRITILVFMEVLAGFFLRQYRIGVEDLKYFLDLERRAKARYITYSIYKQTGTGGEQAFAAALLAETNDTILRNGETTTTIQTIQNEQNPALQVMDTLSKDLANMVTKNVNALSEIAKRLPGSH